MVSQILGEILLDNQDDFVLSFLDDILIYTKSEHLTDHVQHVEKVLQKLREHKLYANPEKSSWFTKATTYLRHEISDKGIQASKEKVQAVQAWPVPKSIKEVSKVLCRSVFIFQKK